MMFSATFQPEIARLAATLQHNAVRVEVGPVATPVEAVRQGIYTVDQNGKLELLTKLLGERNIQSALVFMRTKHRTDRVAKALHKAGFKAQAIHGGRTQGQRQRALDGFRKGQYHILVATDVAARGLDIEGITHVVNYDIPRCADDYVHRIGRTGRAKADGDAITFVSPGEHQELGIIERALGKRLPREDWDGAVHVKSVAQPGGQRSDGKRRAPARKGGNGPIRRRKPGRGYPRRTRRASVTE